jgi:hypothetical protein
MSSALAGESFPEDVFTEAACGAFLIDFSLPQTKADLRPDDPPSKGISATVENLASATITHAKNPESDRTSEEKVEKHSGPASENLAALSHSTESSAEKSLMPISQHNETISQAHPDSEKDEEPPSLPISQKDGPFFEGNRESESAAEPLTFVPSTNAEPLSEEPPDVEATDAPSITALSVDSHDTDDDSALGDPSI